LSGYTANRPYARRGEAALWAPIAQDGRSIVFTDIRGKLFDENQREGNAALGYRHLGASGWNSGLWIGFDRRRTERGTDFDQLSFGGELRELGSAGERLSAIEGQRTGFRHDGDRFKHGRSCWR
jgi:hypothetical protein